MSYIKMFAFVIALLAFVPLTSTAAFDAYLKIDGVDGESSPPPPPPPPPPQNAPVPTNSTITVQGDLEIQAGTLDAAKGTPKPPPPPPRPPAGDPDFDLLRVAPQPPSPQAKGNVEFEWKVEEGESAKPDGVDDVSQEEKEARREAVMSAKEAGVVSYIDEDSDNDTTPNSEEDEDMTLKGKKILVNIRGWDPKNKEEIIGAAPKTPEEVLDEDDLALFIAAKAGENAPMEEISFNFEKITMKYVIQGKLLGLIPKTFEEVIEVEPGADADKSSRVKVKLPWYAFLVSGEISSEDIEEEMAKDERHKEWIEIQSWTLQSAAGVFSSISNVLKTKHDTAKNSIGNIR